MIVEWMGRLVGSSDSSEIFVLMVGLCLGQVRCLVNYCIWWVWYGSGC